MIEITFDHVLDAARRINEYLDLHGTESEGSRMTSVKDDQAKRALWAFLGLTEDVAKALWEVAVASTSTAEEATVYWSGSQFALYVAAVAQEEGIELPKNLEDELDRLGGGGE